MNHLVWAHKERSFQWNLSCTVYLKGFNVPWSLSWKVCIDKRLAPFWEWRQTDTNRGLGTWKSLDLAGIQGASGPVVRCMGLMQLRGGRGSGMTGINSLWLRQLSRLLQRIKQSNVTGSVVFRGTAGSRLIPRRYWWQFYRVSLWKRCISHEATFCLRWEAFQSDFQRRYIQPSPLSCLRILDMIGTVRRNKWEKWEINSINHLIKHY